MDIKPLVGLAGVLMLALTAEFNDQVTTLALAEIRGGFGISIDPGTWFASLFVSAEVIGMALSPWSAVTVSLRRMVLFTTALACLSSVLVPLSDNLAWIYGMRMFQGLSVGLTIPLLMTTALRVLGPEIRLVGLACYALTATFASPFADTLAALWVDAIGDWRFAFLQAIPLCTAAAALAWWGMPEEPMQLDRLRKFDWVSFGLLLVVALSLVTVLEQGDRLDWFASRFISTLTVISGVALPLFIYRQWNAEIPFFRIQLLGRRNVLFGILSFILFLLVTLSASAVPLTYLTEVQGYRPLQAHLVTLEIAALQIVALPLSAWLLDRPKLDSRWVAFAGLFLIFVANWMSSYLSGVWNRDQFYFAQALQAFGLAFVVMTILMTVTNVIKPEEGPFASALFNTPRAITEAIGVFMIQLITRFRGSLHQVRLSEAAGQVSMQLAAAPQVSLLHAPLPPAGFAAAGAGSRVLGGALMQEVATLTTSDTFVILAGLTGAMAFLLFIPERTLPPRIQLAQRG